MKYRISVVSDQEKMSPLYLECIVVVLVSVVAIGDLEWAQYI